MSTIKTKEEIQKDADKKIDELAKQTALRREQHFAFIRPLGK